ncbi:MAG: protein adenylyltransferase SelO family protein, partial [Kangiellaceae bacterium]|nr:protein adenylyltransferase SelO family protein [Kangiellaceae bacterium]
KDFDNLKRLMEFCVRYDFPHLVTEEKEEINTEIFEQWFDEICKRTADMVVHWMRVGFVHGVMNTDNMSILGLTIDYGPYGWLEGYEPGWTPNTTDEEGKRYCFANQPQIASWNLHQLANAIAPIIQRTESLENSLGKFADYYNQKAHDMYANKLGLDEHRGDNDQQLISDLFDILQVSETDMAIFFRLLSNLNESESYSNEQLFKMIEPAYYSPKEINQDKQSIITGWLRQYLARLVHQSVAYGERKIRMDKTNPKYILRNYLAQIAIDKATEGDFSEVEKLLDVMRKPYDEQPEYDSYFAKRPEWARTKPGCSMLSCSS